MTEQEKLLKLRELVEKQRSAIAEKERIIAEKDELNRLPTVLLKV